MLEKDPIWVNKSYKTARVVRKTFAVVAYGVRIAAVDVENKEATKLKIQMDNGRLHPDLDVVKAKWMSSAKKPTRGGNKKLYSSLIIDVAMEDMASGLVLRGLVEAGEAKEVAHYVHGVAQCYKCQEWGHMAVHCKNETKCAECNKGHDTRDHERVAPGAPKACAACGGRGHAAYQKICPRKKQEMERVARRLATRPTVAPNAWEVRAIAGTQQDTDGFTVVKPKKRKAREVADTGSSREEDDVAAPRRVLRVGRPGRLTTKEAGQTLLRLPAGTVGHGPQEVTQTPGTQDVQMQDTQEQSSQELIEL